MRPSAAKANGNGGTNGPTEVGPFPFCAVSLGRPRCYGALHGSFGAKGAPQG
jgi:hypothetical protein